MCKACQKLQLALDTVAVACDQLGECIAMAHDESKLQESGILDPFLTLWRLRWDLQLHGGALEGAAPEERESIGACEHETTNETERTDSGDAAHAESSN